MFFDPFGVTIGHKIELDIMLQKRFEARQHQRESLSRSRHLVYKLISVASEARLCNTDERGTLFNGLECPFHGGESTVSRPLDDDALVWIDDLRCHSG